MDGALNGLAIKLLVFDLKGELWMSVKVNILVEKLEVGLGRVPEIVLL